MKQAVVAVLFLASHGPVFAGLDEFLQDYLKERKTAEVNIFYSQCAQQNGKAVLIFPMTSQEGLLVELQSAAVVNLATIEVRKNEVIVLETHGGSYSRTRVQELGEELAASPFKLARSSKIDVAITSMPKNHCQKRRQ